MKFRTLLTTLATASLLATTFAACGGDDDDNNDNDDGTQGGAGGEAAGTGGGAGVITGQGLQLTIDAVKVSDSGVASVEFSIVDDQDRPLDLSGSFTAGEVKPSFILSRLLQNEEGESAQYVAYTTQVKESEKGDETQSSTDSNGAYETLALGKYRYTFGTKIEISEADAKLTHTLGVYATREFNEVRYVSSALEHWVPDGSDVTVMHDVVTDAACNECHTRIEYHGGSRRGVGMCNLCHTEENSINPESGNTIDFQVMVHKIHMGSNLPSVAGGDSYYFIGYGDRRVEFDDIEYPWTMKDCSKCHDGAQGDRWINHPSKKACTSCHDRTYFGDAPTPEGWTKHTAGPRDDSECMVCHGEDSLEPVSKSHFTSLSDPDRPTVDVNLLAITNSGPGAQPNVEFEAKVDGNIVDLFSGAFTSITLRMWGPNSGVTTSWSENIIDGGVPECADPVVRPCLEDTGKTYIYRTEKPVPPDATGSFTAGMEGVYATGGVSFANPILAFIVTGELEERREIVNLDSCNSCHGDFGFHRDSARKDPAICIACHNPGATSRNPVPDPGESVVRPSINLKDLLHRHHAEARFPSPLNNCETCHSEGTYGVPTAGDLPSTYVESSLGLGGSSPIDTPFFVQPESAACTSCHSDDAAVAHAETNTGSTGEACATCHGQGKGQDVGVVHAMSP